jgi:hypothetical protein
MELSYGCAHYRPRFYMGVVGQNNFPADVTFRKTTTHCRGAWVGLRAGLDEYREDKMVLFLP